MIIKISTLDMTQHSCAISTTARRLGSIVLTVTLLFASACSSNGTLGSDTSGSTPDTGSPDAGQPDLAPALKPTVASVGCNAIAAQIQTSLLGLINEARETARNCGDESFDAAPPLNGEPKLQLAAANHSTDLVQTNLFSHTGSDGMSASDRITAAGYPWALVGENLAGGQTSSEAVVQEWIDSPGHCANLMNANFEGLGAACGVGNENTDMASYWTVVFGSTR